MIRPLKDTEGFSETHAQTPPRWVAWKDIQALEGFHAVFGDERFRVYDVGVLAAEYGRGDEGVDSEANSSSFA